MEAMKELEALNALPPDQRGGTAALTGLEYCNQLFAWEEQFKRLSPEARAKQRLKKEKRTGGLPYEAH